MERIEAHAINKFSRPLDIPDGEVGPFTGFQRAGFALQSECAGGFAGDAGDVFVVSSSEVSGEVPGLLSVATAIFTPCWRNSAIGGFFVSRMK